MCIRDRHSHNRMMSLRLHISQGLQHLQVDDLSAIARFMKLPVDLRLRSVLVECLLTEFSRNLNEKSYMMLNPNTIEGYLQFPCIQEIIHNYNEENLKKIEKNFDTLNLKFCFCHVVRKLKINPKIPLFAKCSTCKLYVHSPCHYLVDLATFDCPQCTITRNDPLRQMKSVLMTMAIPRTSGVEAIIHLRPDEHKLLTDPDTSVEIRSILVDGVHHEQTWPDHFELLINNQVVLRQKPIDSISSLKKRKDDSLVIHGTDFRGCGYFFMQLVPKGIPENWYELKKWTKSGFFFLGVLITKKLRADELVRTISKDSQLSIEDSKALFRKLMNPTDSVALPRVRLSLQCTLDKKMLKTPARGVFCRHFECFSLENFIALEEIGRSKLWKCPICKQKSYNLLVDQFFQEILSKSEGHNTIVINDQLEVEKPLPKTKNEQVVDISKPIDEVTMFSIETESLSTAANMIQPQLTLEKEDEVERQILNELSHRKKLVGLLELSRAIEESWFPEEAPALDYDQIAKDIEDFVDDASNFARSDRLSTNTTEVTMQDDSSRDFDKDFAKRKELFETLNKCVYVGSGRNILSERKDELCFNFYDQTPLEIESPRKMQVLFTKIESLEEDLKRRISFKKLSAQKHSNSQETLLGN
eukprot:TRINITY_DN19873_c0_g1_i1.p1 TRINITY_DN19873_c0_g1~~TRINITY_DN19873_c0_g1_i1.p1  ORF type:complete len:643 (-),score=137.97 TRINITY_DN19873_c0_g1_i1:101-2029(-)